MRSRLVVGGSLVAVLALGSGVRLDALETDQYYAWGRELEDAADAVNAKLEVELEAALASFPPDHPPESCFEIEVRLRKRLRFVLFHRLQLWAINSPLVPRSPSGRDEVLDYRTSNLYHDHSPLDVGTWMPIVPTIEVDGVRFGTDKLSHFVSSGWTLFESYRRHLGRGLNPDEAERAAVRRGILEERIILGGMTSGLVSIADLEAGYEGMRFYCDLCGGEAPVLERRAGGWVVARPIDIRRYVSPEWDESWEPSIYRRHRWRRVRPVLAGYCDRLTDPAVVEQRRRYAARDHQSPVEAAIAEMIAAGRLRDPHQFTIEAVCGEPLREGWGAPAGGEVAPRAPPAPPPPELVEKVRDEERGRPLRRIGLPGLALTEPGLVAASFGVIFSRLPEGWDCTGPCDLWGPFVQLEPGLEAGRVSVGYGRVIGELGRRRHFLSDVYLAIGIKGSLLRTWGESGGAPSGQTYAGPELELSVAKVNLGLGVLRRVEGTVGDRWIVTGTLGWGF